MDNLVNPRGLSEKQIKRFLGHIDKTPGGCWLWKITSARKGYGQVKLFKKHFLAHRISYELHKGFVPENLVLDHLCRITKCVNPSHLEPVTSRENTIRGIQAIDREVFRYYNKNAYKTHCMRGHLFDELNTRVFQSNNGYIHRECRTCTRLRKKRLRMEKRAS
jgi:hypothetical protein